MATRTPRPRPLTDEEILVLLEERRRDILEDAFDQNRPLNEAERKEIEEIDRTRNEIIDAQQAEEDANLTGEEIDARDGLIPTRPAPSESNLTGEEIDARAGLIPTRTAGDGDNGSGSGSGSGGSGSGSGGIDSGGSDGGAGGGGEDPDDDPDDPDGGGGGDGGGDGGDGGGDERSDGGDDNPRGFNLASIIAARNARFVPPGLLQRLQLRLPGFGVTDPPEDQVSEGDDDNPKSRRIDLRLPDKTSSRTPFPKPIRTARPQSDPRVTDPNPGDG